MRGVMVVAVVVAVAAVGQILNPQQQDRLLLPKAQHSPSSNSGATELCELQMNVGQGEVQTVRVEGVFLAGLEGQYLVGANCSGRSTAVEFDLKSHKLWKQLVQMSNGTNARKHTDGDSDAVLVVFEGDFYGPRALDPRLPEAIRKIYRPGWDHNHASMTKLSVHAIKEVKALPPGHPCAPPKADPGQWPCFQNPPQSREPAPTPK